MWLTGRSFLLWYYHILVFHHLQRCQIVDLKLAGIWQNKFRPYWVIIIESPKLNLKKSVYVSQEEWLIFNYLEWSLQYSKLTYLPLAIVINTLLVLNSLSVCKEVFYRHLWVISFDHFILLHHTEFRNNSVWVKIIRVVVGGRIIWFDGWVGAVVISLMCPFHTLQLNFALNLSLSLHKIIENFF